MSGCDAPEGDAPDVPARGGAGADGEPEDRRPTEGAASPEDESDADADVDVEHPTEAPPPGVPVSPEEFRRLKKQAAELPEDS